MSSLYMKLLEEVEKTLDKAVEEYATIASPTVADMEQRDEVVGNLLKVRDLLHTFEKERLQK